MAAVLLARAFDSVPFVFVVLPPPIGEKKYLNDLVGNANQSACKIVASFVERDDKQGPILRILEAVVPR